jgi:hypothetical protein
MGIFQLGQETRCKDIAGRLPATAGSPPALAGKSSIAPSSDQILESKARIADIITGKAFL